VDGYATTGGDGGIILEQVELLRQQIAKGSRKRAKKVTRLEEPGAEPRKLVSVRTEEREDTSAASETASS
jgi:hypothetical protein